MILETNSPWHYPHRFYSNAFADLSHLQRLEVGWVDTTGLLVWNFTAAQWRTEWRGQFPRRSLAPFSYASKGCVIIINELDFVKAWTISSCFIICKASHSKFQAQIGGLEWEQVRGGWIREGVSERPPLCANSQRSLLALTWLPKLI
jgi:hypothetical protein